MIGRFLCWLGIHVFDTARIQTTYKTGMWIKSATVICRRCQVIKETKRRTF